MSSNRLSLDKLSSLEGYTPFTVCVSFSFQKSSIAFLTCSLLVGMYGLFCAVLHDSS
jgi:hypothetical protein